MSIGLWTVTGSGTYRLDTGRKVEGASSLYCYANNTNPGLTFTRKYFACQSFRVEFYIFPFYLYANTMRVIASEYGTFDLRQGLTQSAWNRRRVSFLWDKTTETKWFRYERWTGSEWVLVQGDTSLGSIEPAASTFALNNVQVNGNRPVQWDALTCEVLAQP
jgi:hypothetical protein